VNIGNSLALECFGASMAETRSVVRWIDATTSCMIRPALSTNAVSVKNY
jgi:hypothetical protein